MFAALAEGGAVRMPLAGDLLGHRFGMLVDQVRHAVDDQLREDPLTSPEEQSHERSQPGDGVRARA